MQKTMAALLDSSKLMVYEKVKIILPMKRGANVGLPERNVKTNIKFYYLKGEGKAYDNAKRRKERKEPDCYAIISA